MTTGYNIREGSAMIAARIEQAVAGERVVLVDPPFAYARQMVVRDVNGNTTRVPFDPERVQRVGGRCA